jgi:RNA polymerase sigma-70 factor, ECF subfamily
MPRDPVKTIPVAWLVAADIMAGNHPLPADDGRSRRENPRGITSGAFGASAGAMRPDEDDRLLVAACLARDDRFIGQLVATHRPAIAGLARALLGREEVDDVCQDVYLRVFTRLAAFEHRSRLGTWIYRVTLNVIRNRQRTARRRHLDAHVSLDEIGARDRLRFLVHAASLSESYEQARHVRWAIRSLPAVQRRALVLWAYRDSSLATIARSTGMSLSAVKRTLRLARSGVRTQIDGRRCGPPEFH